MAISRVVDRVGQVLGGRYRLLTPVGTGASATVYLADDVVLRRRVAVKVLHDALADDTQFLKRFRAEAHNAAALNHPHIVAVHDWGQGDVPYLVTELLGGGSLRAMLDIGHPLTPAQARQVALEAARALDYAHRRGLVHRDIKPANLLFDEEGRLRIADFGLARALAEAAWTEPAGAVLGTARYASPEQAQGAALDGRSDVYSLALVIIEAVSGVVPFSADTTLGTLMARVDRPIPVPPALGELVPALTAAGAADPEDRPDADAFTTLLMAAGDLGPLAPLALAGTPTLDDVELDLRETTSLYVGERTVRVDDEPEIMRAPPGTTTDGLTIVVTDDDLADGEQPATRTLERDEPAPASPSWRERRRRTREERSRAATGAAVALGVRTSVPQEVLEADSAPRRRRRWPFVVAALVLVAVLAGGGAAAAYVLSRTPTHEIDAYTSTNAAVARAALEADGFVVTQSEEFSDTVPAGDVIGQDPAAGTRLEEGTAVALVVSLGPRPVPVPGDLGGRSLEEVTAVLTDARLAVGEVTRRYDENWPVDAVLEVGPDLPAELPPGSAVPLVVSDGPPPRQVPDLTGVPEADATAQLRGMGLQVSRNEGYSDYLSAGKVVKTTPGIGGEVPKGGTVTLLVSIGPAPVPVPSIAGAGVADGTRALEAAGFEVAGVRGSPSAPIAGTDPAAGTEQPPGTAVTIITGG